MSYIKQQVLIVYQIIPGLNKNLQDDETQDFSLSNGHETLDKVIKEQGLVS